MRLGITAATLWRWETGAAEIHSVDHLAGLARILECSISDLQPDLRDVI